MPSKNRPQGAAPRHMSAEDKAFAYVGTLTVLSRVCKTVFTDANGKKFAEFDTGWTDRKVYEQVIKDLGRTLTNFEPHFCAYMRQQKYGVTDAFRPQTAPMAMPVSGDVQHAEQTAELLIRITLLERFANRIGTNAWNSIMRESGRL